MKLLLAQLAETNLPHTSPEAFHDDLLRCRPADSVPSRTAAVINAMPRIPMQPANRTPLPGPVTVELVLWPGHVTLLAELEAPTSDSRDFSVMQELADAGFGRCPMSGVPIFDPSRCSAAKLDATWRVYCSVARSATDTSERIAQEATDALDALRQCLSRA